MPRLAAIAVHPVKACHRSEVDAAVVGRHGLVGDREWQVVEPDGAFLNQKQHPNLARVVPVLSEGGITLRHEGRDDLFVATPARSDRDAMTYTGAVPAGDAGEDAAAWFSELLGTRCRLVGMAPDFDRTVRIPARTFPDPDSPIALAVERSSSAGVGFADAAPVLLVNLASHLALVEEASEPFGVERWRGNLVVDDADPWAEDTWRRIRIGDAIVDLGLPWPRCAVPQIDQDTAERHNEPARVLRSRRWCEEVDGVPGFLRTMLVGNALFGVATSVTPAGVTLRVGDEIEVLEAGDPIVRLQARGPLRRDPREFD